MRPKRVPHQEYRFTCGSLPYGVKPDKPMWPYPDDETEVLAVKRPAWWRRALTRFGQIVGWG